MLEYGDFSFFFCRQWAEVIDVVLVVYAWGGAVAFLLIVKEQLRALFPASPEVRASATLARPGPRKQHERHLITVLAFIVK